MSSYWGSYYGTGLALKPKEFQDFLERYGKANSHSYTKKIIGEIRRNETQLDDVMFLKSLYIGTVPGTHQTLYDTACKNGKAKYFDITETSEDNCSGLHFTPIIDPAGKNGSLNIEYKDPRPGNDPPFADAFIIWADHELDGIGYFAEKRAYPTYDSLKQEFKDKLEAYLPEDFDWDGRIGMYTYAAYA